MKIIREVGMATLVVNGDGDLPSVLQEARRLQALAQSNWQSYLNCIDRLKRSRAQKAKLQTRINHLEHELKAALYVMAEQSKTIEKLREKERP